MYLHYVYKMTYYIEVGIFLKNLNSMTFEAKLSYYWVYNIRIYDIFLYNQMCHINS